MAPDKRPPPDLSDPEGFGGTYQRARQTLGALRHVVGVGFGAKLTKEAFTEEVAILVFVREKVTLEDLAPADRVPATFEGWLTDVRVLQPVKPGVCNDPDLYDVIQGGIQISLKKTVGPGGVPGFFPGTLGCVVRRRNDPARENCYLLSNKHVLYDTHSGANDSVYHPIPPEILPNLKLKLLGPVMPGGTYANVPLLNPPATGNNDAFVDAAIARLDLDGDSCCCKSKRLSTADTIKELNLNGTNVMKDVRDATNDGTLVGQVVWKVGRTTRKTRGRVSAINAIFDTRDHSVPGSTTFEAHNTLEIKFDPTPQQLQNECGHTWFAEEGDSGSIVLDDQNRVIGIISHVPNPNSVPPPPQTMPSYACHIVPVLDQLGICIPCTPGGAHGSTTATDGSGLQPSPKNPRNVHDEVVADGQVVFSGPETAVASSEMLPVRLTDEDASTMRAWLGAFSATPLGSQLYFLFDQLRGEMGYLIRNSRPVTVAWHRGKGPAFLAHLLNHLAGHTDRVPHEVQGVTRADLLTRMRAVLEARGSNPLREALQQHGDALFALGTDPNGHTIADWLLLLQRQEEADA